MLGNKKRQAAQAERLQANQINHAVNEMQLRKDKRKSKKDDLPHKPKAKGFIQKILQWLFGVSEAPTTPQETIPYVEMHPDGICQVTQSLYNKTITFGDINYQLAQNEDKDAIFGAYCEFLNYFDHSIKVQLSFVNKYGNKKDFERSIYIPDQNDDFNAIRKEYTEMLKNQLAKGNNGLVKYKYVTFGIMAKTYAEAKAKLERIELDVINNFKTMGVSAYPLSGAERLQLLHGQMHPDGKSKLDFSFKNMPEGASTKDFIVPDTFDFSDSKCFKMGKTYGAVSFLQIIAPELTDKMLNDYLNMDNAITVNLHIESLDQMDAIKAIKRKITDLDAMKIQEQKKAVRQGYDMDVIPTDIATFGDEAKRILADLQSRNERMFRVTLLITNTAPTKQKLDNLIFASAGIAQKYNCKLTRLEYQQEQGLISSLSIGHNEIDIKRGLTTSATAIFVPFTTQELFQDGQALYYGLNALSNNLIMADRTLLKNPNGLILGTPGAGKSFSAKREIVNAFLITDDDVIIADPEGEYFPLVSRLGGQVVKLSTTSSHFINPMDINIDIDDDEDDPLTLKSDFILSLCEVVINRKDGLAPAEKTIIDRCVRQVYKEYIADPRPENMPLLEDLYNLLRDQKEAEAQYVATALEIYVTGSLRVFNNHTNVNLANRLICFDIKELGKSLKKLGMLILMDCVWQRVTLNRAAKKKTYFYVDEFHLLLKEPQTAAYSIEIWKRFRKWGGIPTGLTQNVKDLLISMEVENIFENSDFILMLNQAPGDRAILAQKLGISPYQLSYVSGSGPGEGLMFYGNTIIPFVDRFPKDTELYRIMTTKLSEL